MKRPPLWVAAGLVASACTQSETTNPTAPAGPADEEIFATAASTARFLTQATFGPTPADLDRLPGTSASEWFHGQLAAPASLFLPDLDHHRQLIEDHELDEEEGSFIVVGESTTHTFWSNAVAGRDQLRQRMAFALSQILVVSNFGDNALSDVPDAVAYYQELLVRGAFGNYRDLLEQVTYSPAMGFYLTYMGNQKADPTIGRMPDENYARELLQLFTIGVVRLGPDGEPVVGADGRPIELYTNADITGLARVFTGLDLNLPYDTQLEEFGEGWRAPMSIVPEDHELGEKTFLGHTIAANTPARESITEALDVIFAHPNVGPFLARQLIQRFVTSAPDPAYVARVSAAFDAGIYTLPNGDPVGDGRRGDLTATLAAVLFDVTARTQPELLDERFGKIREPLIRVVNWARAFGVEPRAELFTSLFNTGEAGALSQHPYRSRSVFNFYRPGYVAPGTLSGAANMTVPELQIVNATSVAGYANFMGYLIHRTPDDVGVDEVRELFGRFEFIDPEDARRSFVADYTVEERLAGEPDRLIDRLDGLLTYGSLAAPTRSYIEQFVGAIPAADAHFRVAMAVWLVMTSPDYLVQR